MRIGRGDNGFDLEGRTGILWLPTSIHGVFVPEIESDEPYIPSLH